MVRVRFPLGRLELQEMEETSVQEKDNSDQLEAALRDGIETISLNRPDVSSLLMAARLVLNEVKS